MARGIKTGGRQKGTPNKVTAALRESILEALNTAHEGGAVAYLRQQAKDNPASFLTLVGKLVPSDVNANVQGALQVIIGAKDADL
jgi:Flp pilus assembly CpaF family ATPase